MLDYLIKGLTTIIAIVIVFGTYFGFIYVIGKKSCTAQANVLGYKSYYGIFEGCVLEKPDGKKVLLKQLREFK